MRYQIRNILAHVLQEPIPVRKSKTPDLSVPVVAMGEEKEILLRGKVCASLTRG
jgi:hypothetical protein